MSPVGHRRAEIVPGVCSFRIHCDITIGVLLLRIIGSSHSDNVFPDFNATRQGYTNERLSTNNNSTSSSRVARLMKIQSG